MDMNLQGKILGNNLTRIINDTPEKVLEQLEKVMHFMQEQLSNKNTA